jgi:hypothetical protein
MNYEGNFSERDVSLIYEESVGARCDIKVIDRYKTQNGYMALVFLYGRYCLFFVNDYYLRFRHTQISKIYSEEGAIEIANDIASSIGAEKMA